MFIHSAPFKSQPKTIPYYGTKIKSQAGTPPCDSLPISAVTTELRSPSLLGRCLCQLRKTCSADNMAYSRAAAQHVSILEHRNRLLLFVKQLAMRTLTTKYRIRQNTPSDNSNQSQRSVCDKKHVRRRTDLQSDSAQRSRNTTKKKTRLFCVYVIGAYKHCSSYGSVVNGTSYITFHCWFFKLVLKCSNSQNVQKVWNNVKLVKVDFLYCNCFRQSAYNGVLRLFCVDVMAGPIQIRYHTARL
jgi:hypothetical protein